MMVCIEIDFLKERRLSDFGGVYNILNDKSII